MAQTMYDGKSRPLLDASGEGRARREVCRFGSWNIGLLTVRSSEIADELRRRRVDVCCLQEVRWKGGSARCVGVKGKRYKVFWSGKGDSGGVGVMIKEELSDKVLEVRRKSDRVMSLLLVLGKRLTRVVCAYAPQQGRTMEEKLEFYDDMLAELLLVGHDEFLIVGGDFNGHVGEAADGYEEVHGGYGVGERNEEGKMVLELADATGLVLANTLFKREKRRLITYRSGLNETMVDYMMVRLKDRKMLSNVKVIPGQLQHGLLLMDVIEKEMLKKMKVKFEPRRKTWLLREDKNKKAFEEKLKEHWEERPNGKDCWEAFRDCTLATSDEVCGSTKGKCQHGETWWWKEDVRIAIDNKKKCFKDMLKDPSDENKAVYRDAKKGAKREVAKAKADESEGFMLELETDKTSRKVYRVAKQLKKEKSDVVGVGCIRNGVGKLCFDEIERGEVWKKHMEKIMNEEYSWDENVEANCVYGPVMRIAEIEVWNAMKDMKMGKAAGMTGITAEHFLASGAIGVQVVTELCNRVLDGGKMPTDWNESVLIPIYKGKGDTRECGSYRGVKLLEHGMKIMERVFEKRIRSCVEIDAMQCGFMPGKGTIDAIFMVRMLQEKFREKKKKLFMCFVDLEKAFDRVPRKVIQWALRIKGVNEWLVQAVMRMYDDASTRVRVVGSMSDAFPVKVGVHQGSVLSPLLFIIVMDAVCQAASEGLLMEILYADDLVLMAESVDELKVKFERWRKALEMKGLKVNMGKTKFMISGDGVAHEKSRVDPCGVCGKRVMRNSIQCTICKHWIHARCSGVRGPLKRMAESFKCRSCDGALLTQNAPHVDEMMRDDVEKVSSFVYLGDKLHAAGGCGSAVVVRVRIGWMKFRELSGVLCSRSWSLKMKGRVYKACVRSAMVYGSETWALKKEDEGVLQRAERAMVRIMCGVRLLERRKSMELLSLLGIEDDILSTVMKSRLRWYGHVRRREPEDGIRKVLDVEVDGRRGKGRPQLSWLQCVEKDIGRAGGNRDDAEDRSVWRAFVHGCCRQTPTPVLGENGV